MHLIRILWSEWGKAKEKTLTIKPVLLATFVRTIVEVHKNKRNIKKEKFKKENITYL